MDDMKIDGRPETVDEKGQPIAVGLPWSIVGTGALNGNGQTDILWHNSDTNHIQVWLMDGMKIAGRPETVDEKGQPIAVGLPWSIVGTGDFNGNGQTDILWHNSDTNHIQVWLMDGMKIEIGR